VIHPPAAGGPEFEVVPLGANSFLVRGDKPLRWIRQTDFANSEAVGYLADRLARLGIEAALAEAGATAGAEVMIGEEGDEVVFDWDPDLPAGTPHGLGRRGTDWRVAPS
jgi:GTP-binding protein